MLIYANIYRNPLQFKSMHRMLVMKVEKWASRVLTYFYIVQ